MSRSTNNQPTTNHHVPLVKQGIQWMRDRERGRAPRPHPELRPLVSLPSSQIRANGSADISANGPPDRTSHRQRGPAFPRLWVNVVDGMVWSIAPPPCRPVRGGMLCDEPGLGKTITVLALLLRTRGLSPGGSEGMTAALVGVFVFDYFFCKLLVRHVPSRR